MTKVMVQSGSCGFSVLVTAEKGKDKKIMITLDTECEMVREMAADIMEINTLAVLAGYLNNPVHKAAAKHLRHAACPVPAAVLKALEVEAGLNLPRDVSIVFVKE